ncbi:MAG: hypothetical protein D3913_10590 [Candidatus Electrothrix sp. LOE1_4_5]|nr:hypothetical protein [Candidatus Electrothrix gigas]
MGAPVVLTGIHARKDDTGEYREIKFDNEGHPVSIEQQGDKKIVLNWGNCTIYGEKEWTINGELPDFSSMPPLIVDNQTTLQQNTDPYDSLCFTATTGNGWTVEYFGTKDTEGYMTGMTFINAVNSSTGDSFRAKIDEYGQPSQISNQNGTVTNIDHQNLQIYPQSGELPLPSRANDLVQSTINSMCGKMANAASKLCPMYGLLGMVGSPLLGGAMAFGCSLGTLAFQEMVCNDSPNYPKIMCLTTFNIVNSAIGAMLPLSVIGGIAFDYGMGGVADEACSDYDGNSSGDPHLRTFDGLGYDFQAVGEFIYIQSTQDPEEMTVQIRQESSKNSKHVAWNTAVAMSVGGDIVEINGRNNPPVSINRTPTPMENKEVIHLKNGCKIYAEKQSRYLVIWKDNTIVDVGFHDIYFAIRTSLPDSRKGLVKGLLGNSDGDKTNDLQTRDGSKVFDITNKLTKDELYNQFGNSWRITQAESLFTYAEGEDTASYTDLNFPYELVKASDLSETVRTTAEQTCRDAGITDPLLLEDCILDVGMTGDSTFADNMKDLKPPEQSITVTDDWLLYWDAQKAEGDEIVYITPDEYQKTGMALRKGPLNLAADFEKTFNIYLGDSNTGGYGMIFLLLPEAPPAGLSLKEGDIMAFSTACNDKPCLGVEMDTNYQAAPPGPRADHIALIKNGSIDHYAPENEGLPVVTLSNIENDAEHSLTVSWKKATQTLTVIFNGNVVISHDGLDLKTLLGTSVATYGFVGTTGNATSEQYFYPVIDYKNNLLDNPGFESGLDDWITDNAIWTNDPPPHSGINYLGGKSAATTNSYQVVDLAAKGFTVENIDSGALTARFGGWQSGFETQEDRGKIEITFSNGSSDLGSFDLGWFYSNHTWTLKENTVAVPTGTRFVTYHFYSERTEGNHNDGYLDDAFLIIQ